MRDFDRRTTSEAESATLASLATLRDAPDDQVASVLDAVVAPLPLKIQVQTQTRCNAACVMCPYPEVAGAQDFVHTQMEESLYRDLLAQLAGQPVERFSPFLMNEPLLDRRLERWLALAREALPATTLGLFTNGAALTAARAQALADAGLDELCVSVHGFDSDTYGAVMVGLSYDRIMAQLRSVVELHGAGALGRLRLQIVTGDTPMVRTKASAPPDWLAPHVLLKGFSNERTVSAAPTTGPMPESPPLPGIRPLCQRPFVKLYVLADGACVMCNCDWRRRVVLGRLGETSLAEIWRGQAYRDLRTSHVRMRFAAEHPCHGCDYPWMVDV